MMARSLRKTVEYEACIRHAGRSNNEAPENAARGHVDGVCEAHYRKATIHIQLTYAKHLSLYPLLLL